MRFAAALTREGGTFTAHCLEVDLAGEGPTREEAIESLRRQLEIYVKDPSAVAPPATDRDVGPVEVVVTENVDGPPA